MMLSIRSATDMNVTELETAGGEPDDEMLSSRFASGDHDALNVLLSRSRGRLKRMVLVRMPPQLQARVDASDIIQEAFLQAARSAGDYVHAPNRTFYAWIRKITKNKLLEAARAHLTTEKRRVFRETAIPHSVASISSESLAGFFVDSSASGPLSKVMRRELQQLIQEELESMRDADREVLVLRHFEQMSLSEIGETLEISKSGAAKRYRIAVERLRVVIERFPGLL